MVIQQWKTTPGLNLFLTSVHDSIWVVWSPSQTSFMHQVLELCASGSPSILSESNFYLSTSNADGTLVVFRRDAFQEDIEETFSCGFTWKKLEQVYRNLDHSFLFFPTVQPQSNPTKSGSCEILTKHFCQRYEAGLLTSKRFVRVVSRFSKWLLI